MRGATLTRGCAQIQFAPQLSGRAFSSPVTQFDVFLDLSSFVAVFLGFGRTIIGLAEGVFGIANDFCDGFYGFAHSFVFLLSPDTPTEIKAGEMPREKEEATVLTTTVISTML